MARAITQHRPETPAGSTSVLLDVRGMVVTFQGRARLLGSSVPKRVVDGVSFEVGPGETLGLVGESGSGKTTIGRAVLRLIEPCEGTVTFEGRNVAALKGDGLRQFRRRAQIIFQDPGGSLDPRLRVWATVSEPLLVHGLARGEEELRVRAAAVLERCGLDRGALDRYPHQFSGGQRQRIAIARALVLTPALVVCDEPTSALDVSVQAQVLNLLRDLQAELGVSYLFISHDLGVIAHMCHRVAVLNGGRIVEAGTREQVLEAPRHAYTRSLLAAASADTPAGT